MSLIRLNEPPGAAAGGGGTGDVSGPASSTDNALARFDGATGKAIQSSLVTLSDNSVLVGMRRSINARTTSTTLGASLSGSVQTNDGASGAVELELPDAAAGLEFYFQVLAAQDFSALASGSDVIRIGSSVSSAGGSATSSTVGHMLHLTAPKAGVWIGMQSGTFTLA